MRTRSMLVNGILGLALVWLPAHARAGPEEIDVGLLIERVISGEDFSGRELVITGVALNQSTPQDDLVTLATPDTYRSNVYDNFVSVYDTSVIIEKGAVVRVRVHVEQSFFVAVGAKRFVAIQTEFRECLSCRR